MSRKSQTQAQKPTIKELKGKFSTNKCKKMTPGTSWVWKDGKAIWILYIMAISGSSCSSESSFSIAKHLLTCVSNRTSPKKANAQIFGQSLYGIEAKL